MPAIEAGDRGADREVRDAVIVGSGAGGELSPWI